MLIMQHIFHAHDAYGGSIETSILQGYKYDKLNVTILYVMPYF